MLELVTETLSQMLSATGPREIYPLASKIVTDIFDPLQAGVFVHRPGSLALAVGRGLPEGLEVDPMEGRLACVSSAGVAMAKEDFLEPPENKGSGLSVDAAAPFVDDSGRFKGVISIGGARRHLGDEKRLLAVVARISSIALTHVTRLKNVEELADLDGLTGVSNKRAFQKRLTDQVRRANAASPLSLLLLDIDHFKHYNDTNGHLEGDDVLRTVAHILKVSVREDDVVARYGGEEFVVLYPGTAKEDALRLAESFREAVANHVFPNGAAQPSGALTISGGVATFPQDAVTEIDLVRHADQALYEAKAAGRNRIVSARAT